MCRIWQIYFLFGENLCGGVYGGVLKLIQLLGNLTNYACKCMIQTMQGAKNKDYTWKIANFYICVLVWAEMLVILWLRYPCNHGDDFRNNLCLFFACGVLTVVPRQRCRVAVLVLALLGVLAVLGLDYFNMALDYDTWIQRGMPPWGEVQAK